METEVQKALKELLEKGFDIQELEGNKFLVTDNGMFGFCEDEAPFVVDEEELLEIHEMYLGE